MLKFILIIVAMVAGFMASHNEPSFRYLTVFYLASILNEVLSLKRKSND